MHVITPSASRTFSTAWLHVVSQRGICSRKAREASKSRKIEKNRETRESEERGEREEGKGEEKGEGEEKEGYERREILVNKLPCKYAIRTIHQLHIQLP